MIEKRPHTTVCLMFIALVGLPCRTGRARGRRRTTSPRSTSISTSPAKTLPPWIFVPE